MFKNPLSFCTFLAACFCLIAPAAQSANVYSKDASTCDLDSNTKLSDLCPDGMGMPTGGSQADLIARNQNIANMIVDAANQYGVDPNIALAVAGHESGMSACAGSDTGVQGPMQLTIATGRGYGMNRGILEQNIRGGMMALRDAIRSCGGTSDYACLSAHYNGSPRPGEQANWARDVANRMGQMGKTAQAPAGCNQGTMNCGPGDFPTQPTAVASGAPPLSTSDITVNNDQV